jgi:hypothetical protein
MFNIKSYRLFESINSIPQVWFTDEDIEFCNNILSKKDEILEEFDIYIVHRQEFGKTNARNSGSKFIDLYRILSGGIKSSFGVYDLSKKEFILFYEGKKPLSIDKEGYTKIPSKDFFDGLEMVYYKAFLDI